MEKFVGSNSQNSQINFVNFGQRPLGSGEADRGIDGSSKTRVKTLGKLSLNLENSLFVTRVGGGFHELLVAVSAEGMGTFGLTTVFAGGELGKLEFDTGAALALATSRPATFG